MATPHLSTPERIAVEALIMSHRPPADASGPANIPEDAATDSIAGYFPAIKISPTAPLASHGTLSTSPSPAPNSPTAILPVSKTHINGCSAPASLAPTPTSAVAPAISASSSRTVAGHHSRAASSDVVRTAVSPAPSSTVETVSDSYAALGQSVAPDGSIIKPNLENTRNSTPGRAIKWRPGLTPKIFERVSKQPTSSSSEFSGSKVTTDSIKAVALPFEVDSQITTDFSVKPPTLHGNSALSTDIPIQSLNNPAGQKAAPVVVAFSMVNGRPRLDPVALPKDKAGKTPPSSESTAGHAKPGSGRKGVPKVQTPFRSQRPITESSFDPFVGPGKGESMPFWFPKPSTLHPSISPYGRHTEVKGRTPLPTTPSKPFFAASNGNPRTPLPAGKHSKFAASDNEEHEKPEAYLRMDGRLSDIKAGASSVTLDDLVRLEHMERALLSDFYVLHGVFLPHPRSAGQPNEAAFIAGGFRFPNSFYAFEDRILGLKTMVKKRIKKQAEENPEGQHDWSIQLQAEHDDLNTLYSEVISCKELMTELRKYLERENKVGAFYEYNLKVQYTEIGNQVISKGYRKSGAEKKKTGVPAPTAKTTSSNKRQNVITIDSEDNNSEKGSTPSAKQPPRKKAKTQQSRSAQNVSAIQCGPVEQGKNGPAVKQKTPGQHQFRVMNGSAIHRQQQGPVEGVNGSGVRQSSLGPPSTPGNVPTETPESIDQEIAYRKSLIDKLTAEIVEFMVKKEKLLHGQPGRA